MLPRIDEKQISIKLNDLLIDRLDVLAKKGEMKRNHLMLSFVNIWLSVLEEARLPGLFYISNLLRVRELQMNGEFVIEHEFTETRLPEKNLPIKFSESTIFTIYTFTNVSHISRHQLLKIMIIVGIEELEKITEGKPYQFGSIEKKLFDLFSMVMNKGFKAFMIYRK
jgi:hypothetical protein